MSVLAIKGHATRGNEVIEILEMLGGTNSENCWGVFENRSYIINVFGVIEDRILQDNSGYQIYTLEEFLKKFPYKVGDKVIVPTSHNIHAIESIRWGGDKIYYNTIGEGFNTSYTAKDLQPYKEETVYKKYNVEEYLKVREDEEKGLEVLVNDNFELKEDNGKFYIIKKQPQYPKTYKDCCDMLGLNTMDNDAKGYKANLIIRFQELVIARDAYWKIAGEQMGLGKPWKPQFENCGVSHHCTFINHLGEISNDCFYGTRCLLAFPTKEMRDAFYENFKDSIENCKELL